MTADKKEDRNTSVSGGEEEGGVSTDASTCGTSSGPNNEDSSSSSMSSTKPSLWKLFGMARSELPMLVLALVIMMGAEATNLIIPLIVAKAYDALVDGETMMQITMEMEMEMEMEEVDHNRMTDIHRYMGLAVMITAAATVGGFVRASIQGIVGERLVARLRCTLYSNILKQEIGFFDGHKSGELVSRLGSDTTLLQNVVSHSIPEAVLGCSKTITAIALMFYISPKLAGLSLGGVTVIFLLSAPLGTLLGKLSKEYQDLLGDAQTHSTEAFGSMRTVQAFAAEQKELKRFETKIGNPDLVPYWWPPAPSQQKHTREGEDSSSSSSASSSASATSSSSSSTYRVGFFKSITASGFYTFVFGFGFGFLYVSLWYGFYLVTHGEITLGDLTAFQSYVFTIGFGLGQIAGNMAKVMEGLGASGRIFYLVERIPTIPKPSPSSSSKSSSSNNATSSGSSSRSNNNNNNNNNDDDNNNSHNNNIPATAAAVSSPLLLKPTSLEGRVEFNNVTFSYPSRPDQKILEDYSLIIHPNTTTALVGSSGAGKSTVVGLLQRFYDIDSGNIYIDGYDITQLDLQWMRKQIGYVQQEPHLFGLTIRENLLYGVDDEKMTTISQEQLEQACKDAHAHEFISKWTDGYDTLVGERGVKVSGGQKQRVAIARALLTNCRILLLDEATSALDAESEHLVQQAIDKAVIGRTVIIVAHRLSTIRNAHQIVVMDDHKIVDVGTHEALLARCSKYQDLIHRQSVMS